LRGDESVVRGLGVVAHLQVQVVGEALGLGVDGRLELSEALKGDGPGHSADARFGNDESGS
jgi:hypothetical protein